MNDLKNIKIFNNPEFGEIRIVVTNNESWFVGKDVTDILGYQNGSRDIKRHVDEEDRDKIMVFDGKQDKETIIINESGLYSLILSSKMPNAKRFKRWVISEVLPTIRKTGGYVADKREEDFIEYYFPSFTDDTKLIMVKDLLHQKAALEELNQQYQNKILEQEPMVEKYKILMDTTGTFSMNEVAHLVGVGEYKLFAFLRNVGILFKNANNDNVPYENAVNKTKFVVCSAVAPDGSAHSVTRVLPKGVDYIVDKLKEFGYLQKAV